jgi:putative transposase
MWHELDMEQIAREENALSGKSSREEIEEIVVMVRLELYHNERPCGPKALRKRIDEHEQVRPLPSERTIARILSRNGLTHRRTGWYKEEIGEDALLKMLGKPKYLKSLKTR